MAEMIAMLDGLGAYGQKPIGDVDKRLLPSYTTPTGHSFEEKRLATYPPKAYTLGANGETGDDTAIDRGGMSTMSKVLIGVGIGGLVLWATQSKPAAPSFQGYPEPEMVKLEGPKRRKRRKKRK